MKNSSVKIITRTQAWGQVVVAVAIEYDSPIDPSKVSAYMFDVFANRLNEDGGDLALRTITRVYTNDSPSLTSEPIAGNYVILELNPNDVNAMTIFFKTDDRFAFNSDYDLEYTVNQKVNIRAEDGNILPARTLVGKERINVVVDEFQNFIYKDKDTGKEISCSLYILDDYTADRFYPLVVFLHGAGERGSNNQMPLKANRGAVVWVEETVQSQSPCFVLAPQCPQDGAWTELFSGGSFKPSIYLEMVYDIISQLLEKYSIDKNRIYCTGLSMGGAGTWILAMSHPDIFAALVPVCAGGNPSIAHLIKDIPVWVFTAEDDPVVNVENVRKIVKALQKLSAPVKYTEYEKGIVSPPLAPMAHNSWIPAYNNQRMIEWLFSQSRKDKYNAVLVEPGTWLINDYNRDSMYLIEGEKRAILLDTGMGEGDLREFLKTLTDKPIEVIISHAHPDHILQAGLFDKVYMSSKENEVLKSFGINIDTSRFSDIRDVDMIDLGDRILEVIEVSGHTPGSIVLLDKKNGLLFTGDAIGSGELWMQVPGARTLKSYLESLGKLEGRKGEFSKIYVGHMWIIKPFSPDYLNDVKTAVEKVLNGELEGKPYPIGVFGGLCVTVGSATLVYNADNVR